MKKMGLQYLWLGMGFIWVSCGQPQTQKFSAAQPSSSSEITLSTTEAAQKIGDSVVLRGKVITTYYDERGKYQPVYLNLDKPYPNNPIAIMIRKQDADKFPERNSLLGKTLIIKGKVINWTYNDKETDTKEHKPAVILYEKEQMVVAN